jgi:hypothetical protein
VIVILLERLARFEYSGILPDHMKTPTKDHGIQFVAMRNEVFLSGIPETPDLRVMFLKHCNSRLALLTPDIVFRGCQRPLRFRFAEDDIQVASFEGEVLKLQRAAVDFQDFAF